MFRGPLLEKTEVRSQLVEGEVQWPMDTWVSAASLHLTLPSPFLLGLYPPRAKLVIQRHLSSLTDNEQADIFERVQVMLFTVPV